jgi:hypothetical protein
MGPRVHLQAGDPCKEATALELWAAGELHDDKARGGSVPTAVVVVGLMVALATFFVAFAPPV